MFDWILNTSLNPVLIKRKKCMFYFSLLLVPLFYGFKLIFMDSYLRLTPITFKNCDKKIDFITESFIIESLWKYVGENMWYTSCILYVKWFWLDKSVLWDIEDKQFQDIAVKARKYRSKTINEVLFCKYWESICFC